MDPLAIIVWLVVGGLVGWIASIIMRTDAQQGILLNIVVGIVGAVIGGVIFNRGTINQDWSDWRSWLVSLGGAIILLAIVNLIGRRRLR